MKKIDVGQTINTLANIGVIAGIVFLAIEIRESTRATQAASIQAASALDQEQLLLMGADGDLARLWEGYLMAPESLSEDQRRQGRYLLAATIRRLENIYLLDQMGALSAGSWESRQGLLINIAGSRGFSEFLDDGVSSSMSQEFKAYMETLR